MWTTCCNLTRIIFKCMQFVVLLHERYQEEWRIDPSCKSVDSTVSFHGRRGLKINPPLGSNVQDIHFFTAYSHRFASTLLLIIEYNASTIHPIKGVNRKPLTYLRTKPQGTLHAEQMWHFLWHLDLVGKLWTGLCKALLTSADKCTMCWAPASAGETTCIAAKHFHDVYLSSHHLA